MTKNVPGVVGEISLKVDTQYENQKKKKKRST